jgi:hypothetical protein
MAPTFFFVLYCFEAGVFFIVAPWTQFWTLNPLLHATPALALVAENQWVRGLVSGFGIAHLLVAGRELAGFLRRSDPRGGASS